MIVESEPRGSRDVGLLVLRAGLAVVMGAHGLQKLFGLFGGSGIDGFAKTLTGDGFARGTGLLAWVTALSETGGSLLLLLGFLTPLGSAALLGVALNIVYVRAPTGFFLNGTRDGFEFQLVLAVVALGLLFTGAGRYAVDTSTPWGRNPGRFGLAALAFAVVTSAGVVIFFR